MAIQKIFPKVTGNIPTTIYTGELRQVTPQRVFCDYYPEVSNKIRNLKRYISRTLVIAGMCKYFPKIANYCKKIAKNNAKTLRDLYRGLNEGAPITTVTEYEDSNGEKFIETIKKDITGIRVNTLESVEKEHTLKDGQKIITKTIHDKTEHIFEDNKGGVIQKIEELQTKEGDAIARITTAHYSSRPDLPVTKTREISIDGKELNPSNTKKTVTNLSNGIRMGKILTDPNSNALFSAVEYDKNGIPQSFTNCRFIN